MKHRLLSIALILTFISFISDAQARRNDEPAPPPPLFTIGKSVAVTAGGISMVINPNTPSPSGGWQVTGTYTEGANLGAPELTGDKSGTIKGDVRQDGKATLFLTQTQAGSVSTVTHPPIMDKIVGTIGTNYQMTGIVRTSVSAPAPTPTPAPPAPLLVAGMANTVTAANGISFYIIPTVTASGWDVTGTFIMPNVQRTGTLTGKVATNGNANLTLTTPGTDIVETAFGTIGTDLRINNLSIATVGTPPTPPVTTPLFKDGSNLVPISVNGGIILSFPFARPTPSGWDISGSFSDGGIQGSYYGSVTTNGATKVYVRRYDTQAVRSITGTLTPNMRIDDAVVRSVSLAQTLGTWFNAYNSEYSISFYLKNANPELGNQVTGTFIESRPNRRVGTVTGTVDAQGRAVLALTVTSGAPLNDIEVTGTFTKVPNAPGGLNMTSDLQVTIKGLPANGPGPLLPDSGNLRVQTGSLDLSFGYTKSADGSGWDITGGDMVTYPSGSMSSLYRSYQGIGSGHIDANGNIDLVIISFQWAMPQGRSIPVLPLRQRLGERLVRIGTSYTLLQ